MNYRDSGFYTVNKDTLRIFYSPARFTAADRDSFIKYNIPFPLGIFESKRSDNYFLLRNNKLIYLDSLGRKWEKYHDKKHRIYSLNKVN